MRNLGSSARAIAILAGAGAAAFAVSTAAVSSATTSLSPPGITVKHPFASFSFSGGVSTSRPSHPSTFTLTFSTQFALASNSPGIVNQNTGTLDAVTITERVGYPVPGGSLVGPVRLPFKTEKLALVVAIAGRCFVLEPASGMYAFTGSLKCATATLSLGSKTYRVGSLLRSIRGEFTPPGPASADWTGSLTATFASPGYTFPVATLGSGGGTSLIIGSNGATVGTKSVVFAGATAPGSTP